MCLYSRVIENPKYKKNQKNGGIIPPITDERTKYVPIGCGNCIECRKQKARAWQVRMLEDIKDNKNGKFITLTFSNQSIKKIHDILTGVWEVKPINKKKKPIPHTNVRLLRGKRSIKTIAKACIEIKQNKQLQGYALDNAIATYAVRHWLERWRKKYGKSLRHWLITELGHNGTENIHLHGIIWTDHEEWRKDLTNTWNYGFVWEGQNVRGHKINYVNEATVNYITKYVTKVDAKHKTYKPIILTSAGIGNNYTKQIQGDWERNKFKGEETNETYRTRQGYKIALPIYWRNKIYSDQEREKLWIQKLNKEERWVCGEKVSIKNGEDDYYALLEWHRKRNTQLGYGKFNDWKRETYEHERRKLVIAHRIQNAA